MKGIDTMIIIIGVFIAAIIFIAIFYKFYTMQTEQAARLTVFATAKDLAETVDRVYTETDKTEYVFTMPYGNYNLEIKDRSIKLTSGDVTTYTSFNSKSSDYSMAGKARVYIVKEGDKISFYDSPRRSGCDPTNDICENSCDEAGICDPVCYKQESDGYCSNSCNYERVLHFSYFDPDCPRCGNSVTEPGETCANCPVDIACEQNEKCDITSQLADERGCFAPKTRSESCSGSEDCATGLLCDAGHCCASGERWNGQCIAKANFKMLFIQVNDNIDNFDAKAKAAKDYFVSITPLKNCPDNVEYEVVTAKICRISDDRIKNGFALDDIFSCATSWRVIDYGSDFRIYGILSGSAYLFASKYGYVLGYTLIDGAIVISAEGSMNSIVSHESGHTFGLCDEAYDWYSWCPNIPEPPCIMYAGSGNVFGQTCIAHLTSVMGVYCR